MKRTLITAGLGAAVMYYLDPELGEVRRSILRDKLSEWSGNTPQTKEALKNKAHEVEDKAHEVVENADAAVAGAVESVGSNGSNNTA